MPFLIRPFRRFPVHCAVTYHAGPFQGQGTIWNFSLNGWNLSGEVPLQVGQTCSLTGPSICGSKKASPWLLRSCAGSGARGFGLETLSIEK